MTRDEKIAEATRLRAEGKSLREIGMLLNCDLRRVSEWLRATPCVDCGTLIDPRSERCVPCEHSERTIWTRDALILAIQEWAFVHGEPPAVPDWNSWHARHHLGDEERALRYERELEAGRCAPFGAVVRAFGSWNAGIRAAGFEPRAPHGGNGNEARKRSMRERAAT